LTNAFNDKFGEIFISPNLNPGSRTAFR